MTNRDFSALLEIPAFPADGYAKIADRLATLLNTKNDILLIQGEAIVALEAVATSIARPNLRALNIVTSPYGTWFGTWLSRNGAEVINLHAEHGKAVTMAAVQEAIQTAPEPFDILALVHAESASGIVNPLEKIAALAKANGILTIVDAVASIGGHALAVDDDALDIVVIGPQKALGGPAGVSAISISQKAWDFLNHTTAPRLSILSIMDQKEQWLDNGRAALPGTTSPLEFYAFEAALDRIDNEGMQQMLDRHANLSRQTRQAISAGGFSLWARDEDTSRLVTSFIIPDGIERSAFLKAADSISGHTLGEAVGPGTERLIRINHTGPNANQQTLQRNIDAIVQAARQLDFAFDEPAARGPLPK